MKIKFGIKMKFVLLLSALLFVMASTMGIIMIANQRGSLEYQMRTMAGTITDEFAHDSKIPILQNDGLALNMLVDNIMKYPGIADAYVLNDSMVIEGQKRLHDVGKKFRMGTAILEAKGPPPWLIYEDEGVLSFAAPILFQDTVVGYTAVTFSRDFIADRVHKATTSVIIIAAIAILLVSLLSIPLATRLTRPILRLFQGTKEIAMGNFGYRIETHKSHDEIGELVMSFNAMAEELEKKEQLKGAFNRYVSVEVADEILRDPARIRLGGEKRNITVFFADIRDFTSHSSRMSPEMTVELLNAYFSLITEIVFHFNGTIDKFIGDAVMGVFGSPVKVRNHMEQGLKAVVAIKEAVGRVNGARESAGLVPFRIGIGLDSGKVIVGNMGSSVRMEYTAVGAAVNRASRFSDVAGPDETIISAELYEKVKENLVVQGPREAVIKGIDGPVSAYNIIGLKGEWKDEVEAVVNKVTRNIVVDGMAS